MSTKSKSNKNITLDQIRSARKNKVGTLYLIPTPLYQELDLAHESKKLLQRACLDLNALILIEELKPARKRWCKWGLPREAIDRFVEFNEHNQVQDSRSVVEQIQKGRDAYLFSDGGLPCFCDPGTKLVNLCHQNKIKLKAGTFCNSPLLAMILSGFDSSNFYFAGFINKEVDRNKYLEKLSKRDDVIILMDTPYRLERLLSEILKIQDFQKRLMFLGMDLNMPSESYIRGYIKDIKKCNFGKRQFILIINRITI